MGIGERIMILRTKKGLSQEMLAEKLNITRQSVSKWELEQSTPEVDKIIQMSILFSVSTDELLLNDDVKIEKRQNNPLHFGSVYLIVRDFDKSVAFYEKLLNMKVSAKNGSRFAEFFFDNKCISMMNEAALYGHHYSDGDYKFVLNFWVEDLKCEYERIQALNIGRCEEITQAHPAYHYFHLFDPDNNVIEITGSCEN